MHEKIAIRRALRWMNENELRIADRRHTPTRRARIAATLAAKKRSRNRRGIARETRGTLGGRRTPTTRRFRERIH